MATEQEGTRKLRAILSADVKGYSLLMTNDEASTIKTLKEYRSIMSGIISNHSGNVVDMPGDNIMAEFSSVVNAVKSSVAIQKALKSKNDDLPNDKRLEFRIGINIGDVVQDGNSLYGEGVNIAARIEGLADPGGICISRGAYDHIRSKLKLGYEYIGEHEVKNIKHPVRVYKILMAPEDAGKLIGEEQKPLIKTLGWSAVIVASIIVISYLFMQNSAEPEFEPASVEKMAHPLPDKPSIAVLAFDNMSGDPNQEFFSDGISDEIITALSKSKSLFVVARNSTFKYKGKAIDIKQIAEELGVRYVLEGSVRKSDDKVRITAQLIDAVKGNHLWAERYDRDLKNLFTLQDEITLKIVEALEVKLTEGEQILRSRRFTNLDVKLKFMEVLSLYRKGTAASLMRHGQVAQEVIDMAPEFEGGYVHLGWYYHHLAMMGKSPQKSIEKAFKLAQKTLSLNESDPFAYALLSYLYAMRKDYDKAIAAGEKGVALNPNGADNHFILGQVLASVGRQDEAIGHLKQSIRLDPLPEYYYFVSLGRSFRMKGQYERALSEIKKAHHISPDNFITNLNLAAIYALLDRQKEAEAAARKALEIDPKFSVERASKTWPYKNQADHKLFADALVKAGLPYYPTLPLPDKPSIAVLAFDNMTGDSTLEYFSDGIAEEIINVLSNAKALFVIAKKSSFSYKGKSVRVQQISKELGVRYILEGSVRKSGNKVRITAQLIDATDGQHLLSQSYDRDFDNIFEIQDEISMEVVTNLRIELTEGEQARMFLGKNRNPEGYKKELQMLSLWEEGTQESLIRIAQLAQEIIDIEPESVIGYRHLGSAHRVISMYGESPQENIKKAFELARKAISIDDVDAFSHALLGAVYLAMKQYDKAIESINRSIELQPNGALFHVNLGEAMLYTGRLDEAIVYLKKAIRLNPLPDFFNYYNLGKCYFYKKQFEMALSQFNKAKQLAPDSGAGYFYLALTYINLDRNEEASASVTKALELWPGLTVSLISKISKFKNQAHTQYLIDAMRKAGFPE